MFNKIISFCLKHRGFVLMLVVLVFGGALLFIPGMNVDVLPDLNKPVVNILVEAPGFAPLEIETLVLIPLEAALNGAPGVLGVRSIAKRSIGQLVVEFGWGSDVYRNRQIVSEKIAQVRGDLPEQIQPLLGSISSIMGEIMLVGIQADSSEMSQLDLRTFTDWVLKKRLLTVPGVAGITVMGGEVQEFHVRLDPALLHRYGLTLRETVSWLDSLGRNATGGFAEKNGQEIAIRIIGSIYDTDEIRETVIGYQQGLPVRLGQVANVSIGHREKRGTASINGEDGIILAIQKQPEASTIGLTKEIEKILKEFQQQAGESYSITTLFRQADFIQRAIDNVAEALRDGAIIILVVLFIFFWSIRFTMITMIVLPLSLFVAVLVLHLFGYSINTMTLGGFAVVIGILVDDAIVYTENAYRRLRQHRNLKHDDAKINVIFNATGEIRNVILLSTVVVVLAFLPLLFLGDIEGRLFRPLGLAFIIALCSSTLIAITVTPVLCSFLLPALAHKKETESITVRFIKRIHAFNLRKAFAKPYLVFLPLLLLMGFSIWLYTSLGHAFLPPFNEGTLTLEVMTASGTSLEASDRMARSLEVMVLATPGVEAICRRTGRSEMDEHAEGVHYSELDVILKSDSSGMVKRQVVQDLRKIFEQHTGVYVNISQPISHRLDHLISGIKAEIAVFLYGPSLQTLLFKTSQAYQIIKDIDGVTDLLVETQSYIPERRIVINHAAAARYGVAISDLTATLEFALNGKNIGHVIQDQYMFTIEARFNTDIKKSIEAMEKIIIKYLPDGGAVTLNMVASIFDTTGPYEIKRDNGSRRIAIQLNTTSGKHPNEIIDALNEALSTDLELPEGYRFEIGGRHQSQQAASRTIFVLACLAFVFIVVILHRNFGTWYHIGIVMLNIPLAFIGGVIALTLGGTDLSIAAIVGFVALAGIAIRNDIMMINHFLFMMNSEGHTFSAKMVLQGAIERLIPVLMTAVTSILALLPLVLSGDGAPGKEILYPVSLVIMGGLITSTIINLFLTPLLFYQVGLRTGKYKGAIK